MGPILIGNNPRLSNPAVDIWKVIQRHPPLVAVVLPVEEVMVVSFVHPSIVLVVEVAAAAAVVVVVED